MNTRPTTLTKVSGASFLAVLSSSAGIWTFAVKRAAAWRRTTARVNWMRRKRSGRSGAELRTALLLKRR